MKGNFLSFLTRYVEAIWASKKEDMVYKVGVIEPAELAEIIIVNFYTFITFYVCFCHLAIVFHL